MGIVRTWTGGWDMFLRPTFFTDGSGVFLLGGVPRENANVALFAGLRPGCPDCRTRRATRLLACPVVAGPTNEVNVGDLVLEPPAPIGGVVYDEQGEPVEGAEVAVSLESAPGLSAVRLNSGVDGRFRVDGFLPGRYTVRASREFPDVGWRFGRVDGVSPGDLSVALNLAPRSAVVLRFELAGRPGEPLPVRSGQLLRENSEPIIGFGSQRVAAPITSFRAILPPGRHQLRFDAAGFDPVDLGEVFVEENRETALDVVLTPK